MKQTVLLFNFEDSPRTNKIIFNLISLGIKVKRIAKEDYMQPMGYLVGLKEVDPVSTVYDGKELEGEMLFMAGMNSPQIDKVLIAFRNAGIAKIPYKAILTQTNKDWNVLALFAELQEEHETIERSKEPKH